MDRNTTSLLEDWGRFVNTGDDAGFTRVYSAFYDKLCSYAFYCGDDDPEGVADDAFFSLAKHKDTTNFSSEDSIYRYVRQAVTNQVIGGRRRKRPKHEPLHDRDVPQDGMNPAKVAEENELSQIIQNALSKLHPRFRVPMVMFCLEGESQAGVTALPQ